MANKVTRTSVNSSGVDQGLATSVEHNVRAGSKKTFQAGPVLENLGLITGTIDVGFGASLWIYNDANTVGFIAFFPVGNPGVRPNNLSSGIAVPPNSYLYINSGEEQLLMGTINLAAYRVVDDSKLQVIAIPAKL